MLIRQVLLNMRLRFAENDIGNVGIFTSTKQSILYYIVPLTVTILDQNLLF